VQTAGERDKGRGEEGEGKRERGRGRGQDGEGKRDIKRGKRERRELGTC
jgi:hypothetical protein